MSEDRSVRRREFSASLNGVPSAMDEVQFRQLMREFGRIEQKGLQQRGTASELTKVVEHVYEVMLHSALAESKVLDIAAEELTAEEFSIFKADLALVREAYVNAQKDAASTGFRQMNENIRKTPVYQKPSKFEEFMEGVTDMLPFKRKK